MKLVNNPYNLNLNDMTEITNKVRCIIIDKNSNILITQYADMYMFPGGKVKNNENNNDALIRELKEELGIDFSSFKIDEFITYENYIKNYNRVDNNIVNRLNNTKYYIIRVDELKELNISRDNLSLNEKNNKFYIEFCNLYDSLSKINNYKSHNIRNDYFKKEITDVIKYYVNIIRLNIRVDLHLHTNYSDGDLSPDELIHLAKKNKLDLIAITDHDTITGLKNIHNRDNIDIINGIEFSCKVDKGRLHLLGYNIDINNKELNEKLNELRDNSLNTLLSLIVQLKVDYGIVFKYDDIKDLINSNHHLGRPDLAKLLIKYDYVKEVQEAFDKYLNDSYDKIRGTNKWLTYKEAIELIVNSGGIPILAHPKSLKLENKELLLLLKDMVNCGLKGIEVYHSSHNIDDIKIYENISNELNLLISGGSDYHGVITKPNIEIGKINGEDIPTKKLTLINNLKV